MVSPLEVTAVGALLLSVVFSKAASVVMVYKSVSATIPSVSTSSVPVSTKNEALSGSVSTDGEVVLLAAFTVILTLDVTPLLYRRREGYHIPCLDAHAFGRDRYARDCNRLWSVVIIITQAGDEAEH